LLKNGTCLLIAIAMLQAQASAVHCSASEMSPEDWLGTFMGPTGIKAVTRMTGGLTTLLPGLARTGGGS
jgi:hypothetical protein